MLSLPLGSLGRQWRPVLSCVPEPLTVASFWATWKSIVQGRRAAVSVVRASSSFAGSFQSQFSRQDAILRRVVARACKAACGPCRPGSRASGAVGQFQQLHHAFPAVHAAPADFALGGQALAEIVGHVAGLAEGLRRSSSDCPRGRCSQSSGPAGRVDADDAVGPDAQFAQPFGDPAALADLLDETACAPPRCPSPSRRRSAARPARRPSR